MGEQVRLGVGQGARQGRDRGETGVQDRGRDK